jgi:hypothetical protein
MKTKATSTTSMVDAIVKSIADAPFNMKTNKPYTRSNASVLNDYCKRTGVEKATDKGFCTEVQAKAMGYTVPASATGVEIHLAIARKVKDTKGRETTEVKGSFMTATVYNKLQLVK